MHCRGKGDHKVLGQGCGGTPCPNWKRITGFDTIGPRPQSLIASAVKLGDMLEAWDRGYGAR
jgi:hypothetical protein